MKNIVSLLLVALLSLGHLSQAQGVPNDEKAKELLSSGKKSLKGGSYSDAANKFELVLQRPFCRYTSAALYYAGLSYFYQKDNTRAQAKFNEFVSKFPDSRYVADCRYHQSLMMLESSSNSERSDGLTKLYKVYSTTRDASLQRDALSTLRHFAFNVFSTTQVRQNIVFLEDGDKWILEEAVLYQLDKANDGWAVKQELKAWAEGGNKLSPYMESLQRKYESTRVMNSSELRIAVVLAWNFAATDTAMGVPKASRRALEMYEGMLLALDSLDEATGRQVMVKVFDNRGDTLSTRRLLPDLEEFHPDVILTEGSTSPAQILSAWAEQHGVVTFIPRNPLEDLVQKRQHIFLVNPSLGTHGASLANFAMKVDGRTRMGHFNDKTLMCKRFVAGWKSAAEAGSHPSTEYDICPNYRDCTGTPGPRASTASSNDAVFLPLGSEEHLGIILSTFYRSSAKNTLNIYGHPDWEQFNALDPELKTDLRLTYSTFYYDKNDSTSYESFKVLTLEEYGCIPTSHMVQGFDMMAYLLTVVGKAQQGVTLSDAVRAAPRYRGLHQDFFFNGKQDNQCPTLLRYHNGTLTKVN